MEKFSDLIRKRRSTRKFTSEELTKGQVVSLLKAGLMAPSSKGSTPWQFIVVDGKNTLAKLANSKAMGSSFVKNATLAIVVTANPLYSDVWIEDAAIASIYIQLQAEDLGLGSCWVQLRERQTSSGMPSSKFVHDVLDLPQHIQALSIIAIGHKAVEKEPFDEDKLQWDKVHYNKYGGK